MSKPCECMSCQNGFYCARELERLNGVLETETVPNIMADLERKFTARDPDWFIKSLASD